MYMIPFLLCGICKLRCSVWEEKITGEIAQKIIDFGIEQKVVLSAKKCSLLQNQRKVSSFKFSPFNNIFHTSFLVLQSLTSQFYRQMNVTLPLHTTSIYHVARQQEFQGWVQGGPCPTGELLVVAQCRAVQQVSVISGTHVIRGTLWGFTYHSYQR